MKAKYLLFLMLIFAGLASCVSTDKTPEQTPVFTYGNPDTGTQITLKFQKGKEHNHPLFAVWLADSTGNYIQTLYVSESIGKGVFKHADHSKGKWQEGEIQRPAALPFWVYQRNIVNEYGTYMPTPDKPIVDAHTGATPQSSFTLNLFTDKKLGGKYWIFLELNQSWDWNEYWTNNKYPDDKEYKTSSQPALIYSAAIDTNNKNEEIELKPVGRSHQSGANGKMYTDLNTMTTALKIAKKITIMVK